MLLLPRGTVYGAQWGDVTHAVLLMPWSSRANSFHLPQSSKVHLWLCANYLQICKITH